MISTVLYLQYYNVFSMKIGRPAHAIGACTTLNDMLVR